MAFSRRALPPWAGSLRNVRRHRPETGQAHCCANASPKEAPAGGADTPSPPSRAAGTFSRSRGAKASRFYPPTGTSRRSRRSTGRRPRACWRQACWRQGRDTSERLLGHVGSFFGRLGRILASPPANSRSKIGSFVRMAGISLAFSSVDNNTSTSFDIRLFAAPLNIRAALTL